MVFIVSADDPTSARYTSRHDADIKIEFVVQQFSSAVKDFEPVFSYQTTAAIMANEISQNLAALRGLRMCVTKYKHNLGTALITNPNKAKTKITVHAIYSTPYRWLSILI